MASTLFVRACGLAAVLASGIIGFGTTAVAGDELDIDLPFDFTDAFYIENGINPAAIVGRPTGTPPNSIIDNTPNGPDFNNVRLLQQTAAYRPFGPSDFLLCHGHFLWRMHSWTMTRAKRRLKSPRSTRCTNSRVRRIRWVAVFPKRQDLIADLSGGYFSNDPLGIWQVNIIKYTPAAFNTSKVRKRSRIWRRTMDWTSTVRRSSARRAKLRILIDEGFVSVFIPPGDGSQGLRWFFCPVIEDPKDGAIAPDAHL